MEIWEELKADPEKGARRLVDECGGRLLTAARYITQNSADAEDLVFRTLSKVVSNVGKYSGRSAFFSWMYAIMLNFRRMDLRRRAANMLDFTDEVPDLADMRPDPAEEFVMDSSAEDLRRAIKVLPEVLRVPLILHYYEDYGVSDIAAMTGVPLGTVKFRLYEGRRRLTLALVQSEFKNNISQVNGKGNDGSTRQIRRVDKNGAS
jgi:RNA polymerase sigma-70 factor (ECF subfamily)